MATTRIPYLVTIWPLGGLETPNGKGTVWPTVVNIKFHNEEGEKTKNSFRQHEIKLSKLHIGHRRLTRGHLRTRNAQQQICSNTSCRNKSL